MLRSLPPVWCNSPHWEVWYVRLESLLSEVDSYLLLKRINIILISEMTSRFRKAAESKQQKQKAAESTCSDGEKPLSFLGGIWSQSQGNDCKIQGLVDILSSNVEITMFDFFPCAERTLPFTVFVPHIFSTELQILWQMLHLEKANSSSETWSTNFSSAVLFFSIYLLFFHKKKSGRCFYWLFERKIAEISTYYLAFVIS